MNRMKLGPLAGLSDSHSDKKNPKQDQSDLFGADFQACPLVTTFSSHPGPSEVPFEMDFGSTQHVGECQFEKPAVSCFLPARYESGHSYPLVIWLHSTGSCQTQLNSVMPRISDQNYVGVSLAGTECISSDSDQTDTNTGNGRECFGWLQSSNAIEFTIDQIGLLRDNVSRRFNIDLQRVFIGGLGAGGTMAFRVAFEQPDWFAGVASMNGSLPSNLNPLSNWRTCRRLSVFWAHGRCSQEFPESNLCRQLRLLHVAGFDVTLRQYPCGDQFPEQVYGDLNQWMMSELARSGANIIS